MPNMQAWESLTTRRPDDGRRWCQPEDSVLMWAVDGLANFIPYAVVPLMLLVPAAIVTRRRWVGVLVGTTLVAGLALVATPTLLFLEVAEDAPEGSPRLRVVRQALPPAETCPLPPRRRQ